MTLEKVKVEGFSKMSKSDKINWLFDTYLPSGLSHDLKQNIEDFAITDQNIQKLIDGFSENTIANFAMPYGIAPNFIIDGVCYAVPMVIEESSVVAAASAAAKFWSTRGGFETEVIGTTKVGHISFLWEGPPNVLLDLSHDITQSLISSAHPITARMQERGGGIKSVHIKSFVDEMPGLYQIIASFETCDSMGANFINSVLEHFAGELEAVIGNHPDMPIDYQKVEVVMSILSNYTPECIVKSKVTCDIKDLGSFNNGAICSDTFATKFATAVKIAQIDPFRATTHNKGIYNGIDAVVLATGNDFRAIEAAGHAYAASSGQYRSLSKCDVTDGVFRFELTVPLALGTVGGLTALHPLAKLSLEILRRPTAPQLMSIIASVGLAQNFAAVRSLVTTGIQQGHMKMHLTNILLQCEATKEESSQAYQYFDNKVISHHGVKTFLSHIRNEEKG